MRVCIYAVTYVYRYIQREEGGERGGINDNKTFAHTAAVLEVVVIITWLLVVVVAVVCNQ